MKKFLSLLSLPLCFVTLSGFTSTDTTYKLTSSNNKELSILESTFLDEKGSAEEYISNWLNDDSYLTSKPVVWEETDVIEGTQEAYNLVYFHASSLVHSFYMCLEEEIPVDSLRCIMDHMMPMKDSTLDYLEKLSKNKISELAAPEKEIQSCFSSLIEDTYTIPEGKDFKTFFFEDMKNDLILKSNSVISGDDDSGNLRNVVENLYSKFDKLFSENFITNIMSEFDQFFNSSANVDFSTILDQLFNAYADKLADEKKLEFANFIYEFYITSDVIPSATWEGYDLNTKYSKASEYFINEDDIHEKAPILPELLNKLEEADLTLASKVLSSKLFAIIPVIIKNELNNSVGCYNSLLSLVSNYGPSMYKLLDLLESIKDEDYPNTVILSCECIDDLFRLEEVVFYHKENFSQPKYTWEDNVCTVTTTYMDDVFSITETRTGSYVVDTPGGCENDESGHYEVTFNNAFFETQQTEENSVVKAGTANPDLCKKGCNSAGLIILFSVLGLLLLLVIGYFVYRYVKKQRKEDSK